MMIIEEINDAFSFADRIIIYKNGSMEVFDENKGTFGCIIESWKHLVENAHPMPAYGVSLNKETVQAIGTGVWIEFCYPEPMECYGMPFEKLLIQIEEKFQGFNLIRYNSSCGYDGRCYYLDLVTKDMSSFLNFLDNL